ALVLVTGASMFAETMLRLSAQPLGFAPSQLAVAELSVVSLPTPAPYHGSVGADLEAYRQWLRRQASTMRATQASLVLEHVSATPGVTQAAGTTATPFVIEPRRSAFHFSGEPASASQTALVQVVTFEYFETMAIGIESGRAFTPDERDGPAVAIISSGLARRIRHGASRTILIGEGPNQQEVRVIGVAADVRQHPREEDALPVVYLLNWQSGPVSQVVFRTSGNVAAVVPMVRSAIDQSGAGVVVSSVALVEERVEEATAHERFRAFVSTLFGSTALFLAAVGLYGLASRQVSERSREVGVRAALGAAPAQLRLMVIKDTAGVVLLGVTIGAPLAIAVSLVARSLLYGVAPGVPHLIGISSALLVAVGLFASVAPAERAANTDPCLALRER